MWDFFWTTFKAWVATAATFFFPAFGQLLISTVEKVGFDVPAAAETWFLGLFVGLGVWISTWAAKNASKA